MQVDTAVTLGSGTGGNGSDSLAGDSLHASSPIGGQTGTGLFDQSV